MPQGEKKAFRILIIEESVELCENMELILSSYRHHVQSVHDPAAAAQAWKVLRPEVAFVNVAPPLDRARQFVASLRSLDPDRKTIMVLMSRDVADPETVKSVLAACGADGFVRKPFRVLTLMKKVQEVSARRAASGRA